MKFHVRQQQRLFLGNEVKMYFKKQRCNLKETPQLLGLQEVNMYFLSTAPSCTGLFAALPSWKQPI